MNAGRPSACAPVRRIARVLVVALLALFVVSPSPFVPPAWAASCVYEENLSETAVSFRGRCCLGSIREKWPSQYDNTTLATIKREKDAGVKAAITAYKLLNDSRFRK